MQTREVLAVAKACIARLDSIEDKETADFIAFIMLRQGGGVGQVRAKNHDEELGFFAKLPKTHREKLSREF